MRLESKRAGSTNLITFLPVASPEKGSNIVCQISNLKTDRLVLILAGLGAVKIESLQTNLLEVDLRGAGKIEMDGQADEQRVTLGVTRKDNP